MNCIYSGELSELQKKEKLIEKKQEHSLQALHVPDEVHSTSVIIKKTKYLKRIALQ